MRMRFIKYLIDKKQKEYLRSYREYVRELNLMTSMESILKEIISKGKVDEINLSKYRKEQNETDKIQGQFQHFRRCSLQYDHQKFLPAASMIGQLKRHSASKLSGGPVK